MSDISFMKFADAVSSGTHPTSFGIYNNDITFQQDADNLVYSVQRSVGSPVLESELSLYNIWSCFEEATQEYSTAINNHHARNILIDLLGVSSGTLSGSEGALTYSNTSAMARRQTLEYGFESETNSPWPTYTGSFVTVPNQQNYDLMAAITGSHPTFTAGKVQIRRLHHYDLGNRLRYFDTSNVINFLSNEFGFGGVTSNSSMFYMLPTWENVLRQTEMEFSRRVNYSHYSFDIKGFIAHLYPTPSLALNVYFEYTITADPLNPFNSPSGSAGAGTTGVTSNISNAAFGFLNYSGINSTGKTWIYNMTIARCKLVLSNVRGKYQSLKIPNGEVILNANQLESQATREMENLRQQLRETLDQLTFKSLMQEKSDLQDLSIKNWNRLPKFIYRSR